MAFAVLSPKYPDLELVIVGGNLTDHPDLEKVCAERGLDQRVRSLGFVSKQELRTLYHLAQIFVFPSLYEGFGLPPLEAMACGVPTITSDRSSLREVAGKAALTIDPDDADSLATALRRVLSEPELARELGARGLQRAAGFSWRQAARQMETIFLESLQ